MADPVWVLAGVRRLPGPGTLVLQWAVRDLIPGSGPGLSASLINAVSGLSRLDWSRCCVPLTRGFRILWRILCGSLRVSRDSPGQGPRCCSGPEGTCAPDQARLSASLINAVSGPTRLDWSRCFVPLTRGLRIPVWVLAGVRRLSGSGTRCCNGPEGCVYLYTYCPLGLDFSLCPGFPGCFRLVSFCFLNFL